MMRLILVSFIQTSDYGVWFGTGLCCIGAASFFRGGLRLTIPLTVIMVSMLSFQVFLWPRLS